MRSAVALILCVVLGLAGFVFVKEARRKVLHVVDKNTPIVLISTGQFVDIAGYIADHGYTVIEFLDTSSSACLNLGRDLHALIATRNDIRLRVIDIGSWDSDVVHQYDVEEVPLLWLYKDGTLIARDAAETKRTLGLR